MGFEFFPPEINSGLMYTGPGAGTMTAAAAAWDGLASDLYAAAGSYESVVSGLAAAWRGPASTAMTAAAAPFLTWMNATAGLAEQAGAQASAAVAAYEAAFAMTVPPAEIAANRALLMMLIATNFFGQNFPAIAATEAQYMEMWAQDGLAMNTYAASSAMASTLTPFNAPAATANPLTAAAGAVESAGTAMASWLSGLISALPTMISGLTSVSPLSGLPGILGSSPVSGLPSILGSSPLAGLGAFLGTTGTGGFLGTGIPSGTALAAARAATVPAYLMMTPTSTMMRMGMASSGPAFNMESFMSDVDGVVIEKVQPAVGNLMGQFGAMRQGVMVNLAQANSIGGLSVPKAWGPGQTPALTRAIPGALPQTSVSEPLVNAEAGPMQNPFTQALMSTISGRGAATQNAQKASNEMTREIPRSPAGG